MDRLKTPEQNSIFFMFSWFYLVLIWIFEKTEIFGSVSGVENINPNRTETNLYVLNINM